MGCRYHVEAWIPIKMAGIVSDGLSEYEYVDVYYGNSLIKALYAIAKGKLSLKSGCVKAHFR